MSNVIQYIKSFFCGAPASGDYELKKLSPSKNVDAQSCRKPEPRAQHSGLVKTSRVTFFDRVLFSLSGKNPSASFSKKVHERLVGLIDAVKNNNFNELTENLSRLHELDKDYPGKLDGELRSYLLLKYPKNDTSSLLNAASYLDSIGQLNISDSIKSNDQKFTQELSDFHVDLMRRFSEQYQKNYFK